MYRPVDEPLPKRKKTTKTLKTRTVWPAASSQGDSRTNENMRELVSDIRDQPNLPRLQRFGVTGESPFITIDYFDFVNDIPVDYMHTVCLGVIKRLLELCFSIGVIRSRITSRKLTPPKQFNEHMSL